MSKLRGRLAALADTLGLSQTLLDRARRRYKANRKRAFKAHKQELAAQAAADRARRTYHYTDARRRRAEREDKRALRKASVAYKNHMRAQWWLGRIKVLVQRIHGLEATQAQLEAEVAKLSSVTVRGDEVTGGTKRDRLKGAALASAAACASGHRANFYSQAGSWDVTHCITGPAYGHRDDCSSWETSAHFSAGLPDPNGLNFIGGGFTGTMAEHGHATSRAALKPGDGVFYGPFPHHHTEMYVGPGEKTIGHGSAPVDPGVIDLFGPNEEMHFRSYV